MGIALQGDPYHASQTPLCLFLGCANNPQDGVEVAAAEVKVYGSDSLTVSRYQVVRRLLAYSSRVAFWLPACADKAEGIASLQAEADRLGADGLINVICMD